MSDNPAAADPVTLPPHVTMNPIESSHHSRAGYDIEAQQLYIDFAKPDAAPNIYRYSNFTPDDWNAYVTSDSKGGHFIRNIKSHTQKYPYVRVVTEAPK